MKNIMTALIFTLCILSIVVGKIHWNQKINAASNTANEKQAVVVEKKQQTEAEKFSTLTRHLPENLSEKITNAKDENHPLKIVAVGSSATAEGSGTWTSILQKRLDKAYGKGLFQISVESYGDDLSINVVQQEKYTSVIEQKPDIVLFEPFLLNDNGKVAISNTLDSVEIITDRLKEASEQIVIILQPPNPIHNAVHYPGQVQALKEFAKEQQLIYLNHWSNWPDYESDEILDYIDENSLPTTQGHQVWADYIANYFTGEELE
ncbi:SGNH/GDSL hydrolase family protein [Pueribacillus sp. YX66]|uniref:SGNH/GDSL hydrolase family protein n=1 Tax=Pueribacillus sp. YX66 TaxID=3229242 RepID=UPI00358D9F43